MKIRKFSFLAIVMALLMAFSLVLVACDPKEPEKDPDEQNPGGTTTGGGEAMALVTDESLQDKFVAMYTFEEDTVANGQAVKAYSPYTGEATPDFDGTYVVAAASGTGAAAKDATKSKATLHEGSAFQLDSLNAGGAFPGELKEEQVGDSWVSSVEGGAGMSFSFWYYGASQSDWNRIVSCANGAAEANYGNISFTGGTSFPSAGAAVGRAAYTDESYEAAREAGLTQTELEKFSTTYNVYNAVCGEAAAEVTDDMSIVDKAVATVGNANTNNWFYITVVMEEDAISFYRNGILAYVYGVEMGGTAADGIQEIWESIYLDIIAPYAGDGMKFFGEGGASIDDLLVGRELTYDEVTALYENISGETVEDADKEIVSNLDPDAAARQEAINQGIAELQAERLAALKAARDAYVAPADAMEVVNNGWAMAGNSSVYTASETDGTFSMTVSGTQTVPDTGSNVWNLLGAAITVNGNFIMYMRGDTYGQMTEDHSINTNTEGYTGWTSDAAYADYTATNRFFCELSFTIAWDGTNLTATWSAVPFDAGETYEKEVTYTKTDGTSATATATLEIPETAATATYTFPMEKLEISAPVTSISVCFANDGGAFYVTGLTGGTKG